MRNFTPMIPPSNLSPANPYLELEFRERLMDSLKEEVITRIQRLLKSGSMFKNSDGSNLADSVDAYVQGDRIIVYSELAHFTYMNEGVRPHTMWYLLGKTVAFNGGGGHAGGMQKKAVGGNGKIIRKCTLKAIMEGKWKHPGITGKHYIESGYEQAYANIQELAKGVRRDMINEMRASRIAA